MRIKNVPEFAGMRLRLAKSTEVFPGDRNAASVVREMKLMIKELIRTRDAATLKRIQDNKLTLASAHAKWRTGRLHLAEGHEDKRVVKAWREYYAKATMAEVTRKNRLSIIDALLSHELISNTAVVNELPEILADIRRHYEKEKQHNAFNSTRIELLAFLRRGLGFEDGSLFIQAVRKVPPLRQPRRKEHHPFESPRQMMEFCASLAGRQTPHASVYAESVLFMCVHGLRPEEFAQRRFEVDSETLHLRIRGTKNENADRIVPLMVEYPAQLQPPRIETLNRLFERMGLPVRCRDFRRTYAVWCEAAGIVQSRIRAYMGHADSSVTHTYQRVKPRVAILDEDRDQLRAWLNARLKEAPSARKVPDLKSGLSLIMAGGDMGLAAQFKRLPPEPSDGIVDPSAPVGRRKSRPKKR